MNSATTQAATKEQNHDQSTPNPPPLPQAGFRRRSRSARAASPHLLAAAGEPGPNDRVNLAFIGCGRQTYHHNIPLFVRTPGVQPLAICDVDTWRLEQAVKRIKEQYDSGKAKGTFSARSTSTPTTGTSGPRRYRCGHDRHTGPLARHMASTP
jgi:hypothetical protein